MQQANDKAQEQLVLAEEDMEGLTFDPERLAYRSLNHTITHTCMHTHTPISIFISKHHPFHTQCNFLKKKKKKNSWFSHPLFPLDSDLGKQLLAKCKGLLNTNTELGKQLSQEAIVPLETEVQQLQERNTKLLEEQKVCLGGGGVLVCVCVCVCVYVCMYVCLIWSG